MLLRRHKDRLVQKNSEVKEPAHIKDTKKKPSKNKKEGE